MATLGRGQTFGVTETITNTKLHNLVDLASITGILDADCDSNMNLSNSKLADITSGGKVRGTAILNLPSIPSGAGLIPFTNLPVPFGSTYCSLVSIPNSSLLPLTLASWVDGISLRNLSSIPTTTGLLNYKTIVSSLASGSILQYNGVNNYNGYVLPTPAISVTNVLFDSSGTTNVTISSSYNYMLIWNTISGGSGTDIKITVNGSVTALYNSSATTVPITISTLEAASNYIARGQLFLNYNYLSGSIQTTRVAISSTGWGEPTTTTTVNGYLNSNATITTLTFTHEAFAGGYISVYRMERS